MNQREALLIPFEATADLPESVHLRRARHWAERRLGVLRKRDRRMRLRRLFRAVPLYRRGVAGGSAGTGP